MKKELLTTGLVFLSLFCFSQKNGINEKSETRDYYSNYQTVLSKKNSNYFEIYEAFDAYWNSLDEHMKIKNSRMRKLFKRWDWFWGPRMEGTDGNMNKFATDYRMVVENDYGTVGNKIGPNQPPCPKWKAIGPDSIYGLGPNNNVGSNKGVGRITSANFHRQYTGSYGYGVTPNSLTPFANTLFACSNTGGVFRSTNGGKNWSNLGTDNLLYTGVRDFEISDYNDNEYYFISTYDHGNHLANGEHGTTAIYRTDNGGVLWQMGGVPFNTVNSGPNPYNNNIVHDIEIVPSASNLFNEYVLVASSLGVHWSSDKAVTFNQSAMPPFNANFSTGPSKISSSPNLSHLFLSGGISFGDGMDLGHDADSIYRSINRGLNWSVWNTIDKNGCNTNTLSLGIPSSVNSNTYISKHAVNISPTDANKIWVSVQVITNSPSSFTVTCGAKSTTIPATGPNDELKSFSYLFLSTDGGNTWVNKIFARTGIPNNIIDPFAIVVNPLDDQKLYQYVALGNTEGLYYSDDDGGTWAEVKPNQYHYDSRVLKLKPIVTNNGTKVFGLAGHDGGINLNDDITSDFSDESAWSNISGRGLQVAQIYRHSSSRTSKEGRLIVFGAQDIGHSVRTGFETNAWEQQGWATGDGMGCAFDFVDSTRFYIADGQSASLKRGVKIGATWTNYTTISVSAGEGTYWVAPLLLNPQNNEVVVVAYKNIYKSKGLIGSSGLLNYNKLDNSVLTGISGNPNTKKNMITSVAIAPTDSNVIFGTLRHNRDSDYKRVFRTADGGLTWCWSGTGWFSFVSDIAIHPMNSNIILATFSGVQSWSTTNSKVRISYDQGVTWQDWSTGFVDIPINAVVFDSAGTRAIIATDRGVFVRELSGTAWSQLGCGLPNTIVSDLDYFSQTDKLRASTYGRGMWELCMANCPTIGPDDNPGKTGLNKKGKGGTPRNLPQGKSGNEDIQNFSTRENLQQEVTLFPNPNDGHFKVSFKPNFQGKGELIIKNIFGSILYSSKFEHEKDVQNIFEIDLGSHPSGTYSVTIMTENQSKTLFVIKK